MSSNVRKGLLAALFAGGTSGTNSTAARQEQAGKTWTRMRCPVSRLSGVTRASEEGLCA